MKTYWLSILGIVCLALATAAPAQYRRNQPSSVLLPSGTEIQVRISENLSSETAKPGDAFHGTLAQPIEVDGRVLYPRGTDVTGQVLTAKPSGRLTDPGVLELELTSLQSGSQMRTVSTQPFKIVGESQTRGNVYKIGGGAALGAIIGGLAGGGKGAAIGAGVGAGAGTAGAAATGKKPAEVQSEAILTFVASGQSTSAATERGTTTQSTTASSSGTQVYSDRGTTTAPSQVYSERGATQAGGVSGAGTGRGFSSNDQRIIRNCLDEHVSTLPSDMRQGGQIAAGNLQQGDMLSPDLQSRVHLLPDDCERRLARPPMFDERVMYNGRVMLIDPSYRVLDWFDVYR
jgi:hypothetical protein